MLVAIDAVLDPGAVRLGFWEYAGGGFYYGVPISNFFGWLLSGALAAGILLVVGRARSVPPPGMVDSAVLAVAFWVGVAVFTELVLPGVVGAALLVFLLVRRAGLATAKTHTSSCKAV